MKKNNYFDIKSEEDKKQAIELIKTIDINSKKRVYIETYDKIKTIQQLSYFHKIVKEFTEFMIYNNISSYSEGDWKATIKRKAHFFQANSGLTFLNVNTKKTLYLLIEKSDKLTREQKDEVYLCFREQTLKSMSDATAGEVNLLINTAIELCIDIFNSIIEFNKEVEKKVFIQNLKENHNVLYELIMKWREGYLNQEVASLSSMKQKIFDKVNNFFY